MGLARGQDNGAVGAEWSNSKACLAPWLSNSTAARGGDGSSAGLRLSEAFREVSEVLSLIPLGLCQSMFEVRRADPMEAIQDHRPCPLLVPVRPVPGLQCEPLGRRGVDSSERLEGTPPVLV